MRIRSAAILALALSASTALAAGKPAAKAPSTDADGWPAGPVGARAAGWVGAFNAGPDSMRAFIASHTAPAELRRRGVAARVESYAGLRARFGTLLLLRASEATPGSVTATLLDADGASQTFVFRVETAAPHRMISVSMHERRSGHGHGSGAHDGGGH